MKKKDLQLLQKELAENYKNEIRQSFIKNIMIGFESTSGMYLNKINEGCSLEELKEFILLCNNNNDKITEIISKKYVDKTKEM